MLTLRGANFTPATSVGFLADPAASPRAASEVRFVDEHTLEVVVDGDLCVAVLDGRVSLSTRLYDRPSGRLGLFVGEGAAVVTACRVGIRPDTESEHDESACAALVAASVTT